MTEKPASIVRRRLEQVGYDEADDLRSLAGEDIQYLMKFVYKSNVLGPAVCRCVRSIRSQWLFLTQTLFLGRGSRVRYLRVD